MNENKVMLAVSGEVYWRDPDLDPPPRGAKMLILTDGGVAVIGDWMDNSNFSAWSPLPKKRPIDLPARIVSILRNQKMSADDLAMELLTPRSTVISALNALKKQGKICIASYHRAGKSPIRIWGLGDTDAEKPKPIEQKSKKTSEKKSPDKFVPRRDVAASWI